VYFFFEHKKNIMLFFLVCILNALNVPVRPHILEKPKLVAKVDGTVPVRPHIFEKPKLVAKVDETQKLRGSGGDGSYESVRNTDIFKKSCTKACNSCFIDHSMHCHAQCFKGCQPYCTNVNTLPGCSEEEMWTATPGAPLTLDPKYRFCRSDDSDGCPSAYLFD